MDSLLRQLKIWEIDIGMLSETCVAWEDQIPRRVIQNITKQYDLHGCWTVSSSKLNVGSYVKPGGTGILAMGKSNGTIIDRGADPWKMGRWSYILIQGKKEGQSFLVVTGYRPGKRNDLAGVKTAWAQQQTILYTDGRREKPHEAFLIDLTQWLLEYRNNQMEIMVWLDANEQWSKDGLLTNFARKFDLVNINEEMGLPATHPNIVNPSRSTTIDFGLCSQRVLDKVTYVGAAPYDMDTLGDHRGVVIDIDIQGLLGVDKVVEEMRTRKLVMSDPKAVNQYLITVDDKFQAQNIYQRTKKLLKKVTKGYTDLQQIMKQYEAIDKEVLGICKKAEKKCKPTWAG